MSKLAAIMTPLKALISRSVGLLFLFLMQIALSRSVGAEGMGTYALFATWMVLFAAVAEAGSTLYTMRTVSVLAADDHRHTARVFTQKMLMLTGSLSLLLILLSYLSPDELQQAVLGEVQADNLLLLSAIGGCLFLLIRVLAESLKGLGHLNLALNGEKNLQPVIALIVLLTYWALDQSISIERFIDYQLLILLLIIGLLFFRMIGLTPRTAADDTAQVPAALNKSMLPFWTAGLLNILFMNLPILFLPQFASTDEIGVFGVVYRLIALGSIILVTLSGYFGPKYARAYANGDFAALKAELRLSQLLGVGLFMPVLLICVVFAEEILAIFGEEFVSGYQLLWIMIFGQFVHSVTGLQGYMLNMIHREKVELKIFIFVTLLLIVLTYTAGHYYGVVGVAVAYTSAMLVKSLLTAVFTSRALKDVEKEIASRQ